MPYITKADREDIDNGGAIVNCGSFNYAITQLAREYVAKIGESYQTYNDLIGALECAKLELYRRRISLYEDAKIDSNGDVYE